MSSRDLVDPPNSTALVTSTWALVKKKFDMDDVGMMIYDEMFRLDPTLPDTLFKGVDQRGQSHLLMLMIDGAVGMLTRNPIQLYHDLVKLGERHAGYGVVYKHYPMTGQAVMNVLGRALGPDVMTPDTVAAWGTVYGVIQAAMLEGATTPKGKELAADYRRMHETPFPWGPIAVGVACVALAVAVFKK